MTTYTGTSTAQTGSIKTAGTTVAIDTALGTVPAGALILAQVTCDNIASTTAPTVSSLSKPASETNAWELVGTIDAPNATAAGAVITHVWKITASVAWTGHTVTATLSDSVTAKSLIVRPVWDTGAAELFVHAWVGAQTGSLHLSNQMDGVSGRPGPPQAGEAVVWGSGTENNSVFPVAAVHDASGSGGIVISPTVGSNRGTSGGGAASNVWALLTLGFTDSYTGVDGTWANVSTGGPTTSIGGSDGGCWIAIIGPARGAQTFQAASTHAAASVVTAGATADLGVSTTHAAAGSLVAGATARLQAASAAAAVAQVVASPTIVTPQTLQAASTAAALAALVAGATARLQAASTAAALAEVTASPTVAGTSQTLQAASTHAAAAQVSVAPLARTQAASTAAALAALVAGATARLQAASTHAAASAVTGSPTIAGTTPASGYWGIPI